MPADDRPTPQGVVEREIRAVKKLVETREDIFAFRGVADRRGRRGRRWALAPVLATVTLGLAAGEPSVRGIEDRSLYLGAIGRRFGIRRRVPRSTIGQVVAGSDPEELRRHLGREIRQEHRRKSLRPVDLPVGCVAFDGKTIRAVHRRRVNDDCQEVHGADGQTHYLYRVFRGVLFSAGPKLCLAQMTVPAETNEAGCFGDFFAWVMEQYGRSDLFEVVFADSGSTSAANATAVDAAGKGYVLALKGNQPELEAEARRMLRLKMGSEPPTAEDEAWQSDHRGGWIRRRMWSTDEIAGYLWPHLRQAFVVQTVERVGDPRQGPCTERVREERCFVSNLSSGHRLRGATLLRAIRLYWQVEEYFCVADVELHEDDRPFTQVGNGVAVMTLLRVFAQNLLVLVRDAHLRSAEHRRATWRKVKEWVRDTLKMIGDLLPEERPEPAAPD